MLDSGPVARTVLITGSPGGLAEALSTGFRAAGWDVRGHDPDAELVDAARGAEVLVHAGVRVPRDWDLSRRGPAEAGAALDAGMASIAAGVRRFIMVSTAGVYGRPRTLPCAEGEPKEPRTDRERSRWLAEQAAWTAYRHGAPLTVLRPAIVYGPTVRGGPARAMALLALWNRGQKAVPILRRGPVTHLCHLEDLAGAAIHVAAHPRDEEVLGRAFNVADETPLPFAEHMAASLEALGHVPGRILPYSATLASLALWLIRRVPDRWFLWPVNRRLRRAWDAMAAGERLAPGLYPRVDREALHWMSADHYYDVSRLSALGWRAGHPSAIDSIPLAIRALVEARLLPASPFASALAA